MFQRHKDKSIYFEEQSHTTEKFVIPYIEAHRKIEPGMQILEIGCGEGGNLRPFIDRNCLVTGIDLSEKRIELAQSFFENHPKKDNLTLLCLNVYDAEDRLGQYDVVLLRDVIEHIFDQEKFMGFMKRFLKPDGIAFFAFPPWQNPFGGHQQVCQSWIISKFPYIHLLPTFLYKGILTLAGETEGRIKGLMGIKRTGISIERFKRILNKEVYHILEEDYYLINPNYETKFGLKPRKQSKLIASIPWLRNFLTTAMYYVIKK